MQEKDIKRLVIKQLKTKFPYWRRLSKKQKKDLAEKAIIDVMASYKPDQAVNVPLHELINMSALPADIIPLSAMGKFIEDRTRSFLSFTKHYSQRYLDNQELRLLDNLLDDRVLNDLLASPSFTPTMRLISPATLFRAELLKALWYADLSYRKYCALLVNRLENKAVRSFLHLPLHKKILLHHSQLSQFRSTLTITQMVNLMVYVTHLLVKEIKLPHPFQLCGADSTDLASSCCPVPLATLNVGQKKVRIYDELDADCGKRRKKRNKSEYFVGYRLHSLAVIDPHSGHTYPLLSLVAPANHHDNLLLPQLVAFGQAMGLNIKMITADAAYGDAEQNQELKNEHGVTVVTAPSQKVKSPEHVDTDRCHVFMDDYCEIPMRYLGTTDTGHEFGCDAQPNECFRAPLCPQCRELPFDSGQFGQLPDIFEEIDQIRRLRKHMERSYNLFKHCAGLERLRLKSQQSVMAAVTFAQLATVLIAIARHHETAKKEHRPKQLQLAAQAVR
jgi:hypothetical protein